MDQGALVGLGDLQSIPQQATFGKKSILIEPAVGGVIDDALIFCWVVAIIGFAQFAYRRLNSVVIVNAIGLHLQAFSFDTNQSRNTSYTSVLELVVIETIFDDGVGNALVHRGIQIVVVLTHLAFGLVLEEPQTLGDDDLLA